MFILPKNYIIHARWQHKFIRLSSAVIATSHANKPEWSWTCTALIFHKQKQLAWRKQCRSLEMFNLQINRKLVLAFNTNLWLSSFVLANATNKLECLF